MSKKTYNTITEFNTEVETLLSDCRNSKVRSIEVANKTTEDILVALNNAKYFQDLRNNKNMPRPPNKNLTPKKK
tara:strand:+ start:807 stop:1028 length:222 start_codon:yes stop_codon:yes gene_type:complete